MHRHTDRIIHTTAFVTPVVEHWLEREIAQCVYHEGSIRKPIEPLIIIVIIVSKNIPPWYIIIYMTVNTSVL